KGRDCTSSDRLSVPWQSTHPSCWCWRRSACGKSGPDMRRLLHIMRKELIELRQDPKLFGVLFIAPIVQLVVLGYAATTDVKNVPIVIADGDRSSMSRELISQFEGSPYFTVAGTVTTMNQKDDCAH